MSLETAIPYLNFIGILNARFDGSFLKFSWYHAVLNILKIFTMVYFRVALYKLFTLNAYTSYQQDLTFSPVFYALRSVRRMLITALPIFLQLIASNKNILLINKIIAFKAELIGIYEPIATIFVEHKKFCRKRLTVSWIIFSLCFAINFAMSMHCTFSAVLAYATFLFPFIIILSFGSYVFVIIEFMICCQRAFGFYLEQMHSQSENKTVDTMLAMRVSLIALKNIFVKTAGITIFETIFSSFFQIICMVSDVQVENFFIWNSNLQCFYAVVILFETSDVIGAVSPLTIGLPIMVQFFVFIVIPGERVEESEKILIQTILKCHNYLSIDSVSFFVSFKRSLTSCFFQINEMLKRFEHQPMTITLFNLIALKKSMLSFFVMETSTWLFTLLQFELDFQK